MKRWFWMLVVTFALLAGCGNKGALYLPDQADPAAPAQQSPAPQQSPAQY